MVPDEKGSTTTCKLSLGKSTTATIYNFSIGSNNMLINKVSANGRILSIKVTETPVFVEVTN